MATREIFGCHVGEGSGNSAMKLLRRTLSFSKHLDNPIGALWNFIHPDNRLLQSRYGNVSVGVEEKLLLSILYSIGLPGTGLGLAIAHQIVIKKHGECLEVHSKLGQVTEFCIWLPIMDGTAHLTG